MNTSGTSGLTVQVGVVHSLSGTMAISESPLKDAALMAIAEINQSGGVLGREIVPLVEDSASVPVLFGQKVRTLIQYHGVTTVFGGWSSAARKQALPVLEELNALLWYPLQYEGLEESKNIFYTGACPNQQVKPAVQWLMKHRGKRFYLLGMDYVFPRVCNKIIKSQLIQDGGCIVGETYPPLGAQDFTGVIEDIQRLQPDVIFSTLNGDGNIAFYQQYHAAGITADDIPVLGVSVCEQELQGIGAIAAGHYAAWTYFQSLDTPANQAFVQQFQARYGGDRVTSDPIEAAYGQVYLWKQAVEAAQSFHVDDVREAAYGQSLMAPGGEIRVERNHHLWKESFIGQIGLDGQLAVVARSHHLIKPQPWLGIEDATLGETPLVIDLLSDVPNSIQTACQLEQKSRELQLAMAELIATNAELQQAQAQLQEAAKREDLLKRRLSSQIRNSLELDTILNTAVHEVRHLLNIDCCKFLWCRVQDHQPLIFAQTHLACAPHETPHPILILPEYLGWMILQVNVLQVDDVTQDPTLTDESQAALQAAGVRSMLAIAIHTHTNQVGIVVCEHRSALRPWSPSEVELLEDVADQLAIAIEQANLYEQSRIAATQAQAQAQELEETLFKLKQTQAQLIQTEKMSGLGQLVAGVAHEINNPVNFIYGNLSYVKEYAENLLNLVGLYQRHYPTPSGEIDQYLEAIEFDFVSGDFPKVLSSIRIGADRIRQIVLSLRNFSRLDESAMKFVDIHDGLNSTLLILQHRLKSKPGYPSIQIILDYNPLPPVECYAGQLNQVFMNILSNAIDALLEQAESQPRFYPSWEALGNPDLQGLPPPLEWASPDAPRPTIWVRTAMSRPGYVLIRLADNGPGMDEATRARLFDPFFTTKPVGQGTGLGLSISYQIIVEAHRGSIRCVSEPGQGAEFWIEIPVHQNQPSLDSGSRIDPPRPEATDFS